MRERGRIIARVACVWALTGVIAGAAHAEPYPGWYPQFWAEQEREIELLWNPWPSADEIRTLGYLEVFDFPPTPDSGQGMIHQNGYVEIVTEDGEMGWIPVTVGISLTCGRPGYRAPPDGH